MSTEKKVVEIKIEDILPNRFQPRIKFDEEAISDLSNSIKEHGVIQPLVVRKIGDKFEIIAGERRYKASVMAGLETVPAIVTDLNDKDSAEVALIENVQRQNLTPIEEAVSYKKILDMGYLTQEQLADKLGKSQSSIANKLRLLNLDDDVQEALLNGQISERHARSLLKLPNSKLQVEMLDRIIEERLTVRRTDEEIDKMLNDLFNSSELDSQEEKEEAIEHTQPLSFDFNAPEENGPKENLFDMQVEKDSDFNMSSTNDTDFFGFNQNIMDEDKKIEDEPVSINNDFVDIDKITTQAQDLYPEEEKKDINSFLEPTLILNDEEEEPEQKSNGFTFDEINASVDDHDNEKPEKDEEKQEEKEVELNYDMKPGKFFNLFNDEPVENSEESKENDIFSSFGTMSFDTDLEPVPNDDIKTDNNVFNIQDDELEAVIPQKLEAEDIEDKKPIEKENNIDLAREKIKLYAEELKKLGIDMNIEESDFENKYQITINIDK